MAQQRVPGGDMDGFLDVRWANEDPNPRAQARVKREHASAFSQVPYTKRVQLAPLHRNVVWRDRGVRSLEALADVLHARAQPSHCNEAGCSTSCMHFQASRLQV